MKFLKRLWAFFAGSRGKESADESAALTPSEVLTRFLTSASSHFSRTNGVVRPGAYLPARDGETSTFRTSGLSESQVWGIGDEYVVPAIGKPILGRGETTVADVTEIGLSVNPDNDPPRHAGIVGWPEEKHEQKALALDLAQAATLRLRGASSAPPDPKPDDQEHTDPCV